MKWLTDVIGQTFIIIVAFYVINTLGILPETRLINVSIGAWIVVMLATTLEALIKNSTEKTKDEK